MLPTTTTAREKFFGLYTPKHVLGLCEFMYSSSIPLGYDEKQVIFTLIKNGKVKLLFTPHSLPRVGT